MTYDQIINLLDRGFTPDQISGLSADVPQAVTPPVNPSPGIDGPAGDPPVTPSEGSPAPDPGPEEQPEPAEPAEPIKTVSLMDYIRDMQGEIANLKAQMQKTNIITRSVERIPVSATQVDSVLAEFIRPPVNIEKK